MRTHIKETSKSELLVLCEGNSPVTGEFPAQRASNAEKGCIWWRHHVAEEVSNPVPTYPSSIAHNRLALLIFSWKDDENNKL